MADMIPHLAILMATYNGETFLQQQLDSLYRQTYTDWTLYIHDDGSSDHTIDIILRNSGTHDHVVVLDYAGGNGAKDNFLGMLERIDAEYYMFCDQDDVWADNKIEVSMSMMRELEQQKPSTPIVVCTDLHVVDKNLNIISRSYWQHAGIYPEFIHRFAECAASSVATGCTMLFNQQAKQSTIFPAHDAIMHDAWVTLCTLKASGILYGIDQQLILYRQHDTNSLGATSTSVDHFTLLYRFRHFSRMFRQNRDHYAMLRSLGYGSVIKYLFYKIVYKYRIQNKKSQSE